jgi:N-acetylmuramate 1-kinase
MTTIERRLQSQAETEALAAELSLFARAGTVILLVGELGAGKSTFARAFIQALALSGNAFDIPSPTFTLIQTYDETRIPVAHADLYRLTSASELDELGLEDLLSSHILLVEWPERLALAAPAGSLRVTIGGHGTSRSVRLEGEGAWSRDLQRNEAILQFVSASPWRGAKREFLEGDASFRRYETLKGEGPVVILMDMPARSDGPPVKNGKPYSGIAHLAENIAAAVAVNEHLISMGYSAPRVYHCRLDRGMAIIEHFGSKLYGRMMLDGADMREPLAAAVELLADMARRDWPDQIPVPGGGNHLIHRYDRAAQEIEIGLLPMWFWPHLHGAEMPAAIREEFEHEWAEVLPLADPATPFWTLRDYHSPNLLWLPERRGMARVGLIDTQDCLLGHPAYDLASLLQDARVDIAIAQADELFDRYCALRSKQGAFARRDFETAYAVLGAQRACKILGIFARLSKRDGKHGYLPHMPRVSRALERNLQHPALAGLKTWFGRHLSAAAREGRR